MTVVLADLFPTSFTAEVDLTFNLLMGRNTPHDVNLNTNNFVGVLHVSSPTEHAMVP